jgi:hypothetical protein
LGSFIFAAPIPDPLFDLFRAQERHAGGYYLLPQCQEAAPARSLGEKDSASRQEDLLTTLVLDMLILPSQNNNDNN